MDYESQIFDDFQNLNLFTGLKSRHVFLRKVYSLLCCTLIYTFSLVLFATYNVSFKIFAQNAVGLYIFCLVLIFVLLFSLFCLWEVQKIFPYNYMFLTAFTLPMGYLVAVAASIYDAELVLFAMGATVLIVLGLTLFSFQTKIDFTEFYGILFVALLALTICGIMIAIFCRGDNCHILNLVYTSVGIFVFCFYIVADTQMMMNGDHKHSYGPDDYVIATISLYLDIVNLFLYILKFLNECKKD